MAAQGRLQRKNKMKTNITNKVRRILAAGLIGLAGITQTASAQTNAVNAVSKKAPAFELSGDLSYFMAEKSESGTPTSYPEVNYSMKLPFSIKASGYMDFYNKEGYFGKTIIEKGITDKINVRAHAYQINEPFSQGGLGLSYVIPTPKKIFAKISYLPVWMDSKGESIRDKQIVGIFASVDLPQNFSLWGFGEINPVASNGPQWSYGEIELAKNFGKRFSVGANFQLNCKGKGILEPEVIPRVAIRAKF